LKISWLSKSFSVSVCLCSHRFASRLESLYYVENQDLRSEVANLNDLSNDLKAELVALNKEKLALEKKVNQQSLK
jgi:hypothetical protein